LGQYHLVTLHILGRSYWRSLMGIKAGYRPVLGRLIA